MALGPHPPKEEGNQALQQGHHGAMVGGVPEADSNADGDDAERQSRKVTEVTACHAPKETA